MPNKRLKIALIAPCLPAKDTSGCAKKIYDSISSLKERGYDIYLISFCSEEDKKRIEFIKVFCTGFYLECIKDYFYYPDNINLLRNKIKLICKEENIDILQCEKAYMSKYMPDNVKVPAILVEHEILSSLFLGKSKLEANIIKSIIFYARGRKKIIEERGWYRKFDKIIVFSEEDKEILQRINKIENIEVVPLGVDLANYSSISQAEKKFDIIFAGNFEHSPNVDAVLYFYKEIFPLIKTKMPNVSVVIAGANPPADIKNIAERNKEIAVTGYVEDILEVYSKSKVFIAPIRYGTGMRLKILEAMALGIPVVSTSIGARGISGNSIAIADTSQEFGSKVIKLLWNSDNYGNLSREARTTIEKFYNWKLISDKYENIYYELITQYGKKV